MMFFATSTVSGTPADASSVALSVSLSLPFQTVNHLVSAAAMYLGCGYVIAFGSRRVAHLLGRVVPPSLQI